MVQIYHYVCHLLCLFDLLSVDLHLRMHVLNLKQEIYLCLLLLLIPHLDQLVKANNHLAKSMLRIA
jgi:hypothetical protein